MIVAVLATYHTQYTLDSSVCIFYLIEEHSKFLLHILQLLYMCTLCDSTNINTIIEFVPRVSGDGFNGGSDSYFKFQDTHAPSLLKLCTPTSNGIVRWWFLPEFGAEFPLDNCTQTIILNNTVLLLCINLDAIRSFPPRMRKVKRILHVGKVFPLQARCGPEGG